MQQLLACQIWLCCRAADATLGATLRSIAGFKRLTGPCSVCDARGADYARDRTFRLRVSRGEGWVDAQRGRRGNYWSRDRAVDAPGRLRSLQLNAGLDVPVRLLGTRSDTDGTDPAWRSSVGGQFARYHRVWVV